MCSAKNIHTSPVEGVFSKTSPPIWKFQLSPGNSNPFCTGGEGGGVGVGIWIFSGTAHYSWKRSGEIFFIYTECVHKLTFYPRNGVWKLTR